MSTKILSIHPDNPQPRKLQQVADVLHRQGIIAYPTESGYALGCCLDNKDGADRIRQIRQLDKHHDFTLMCKDLKHLSDFSKVSNAQFRLMKANVPGAFTFILEASRDVPRRLQSPKRKTIGVRVTTNEITQHLLGYLQGSLMSVSLILPGEELPMSDAWAIHDEIGHSLDLIVDGGFSGYEPTTVVDLLEDDFTIVRQGQGVLK